MIFAAVMPHWQDCGIFLHIQLSAVETFCRILYNYGINTTTEKGGHSMLWEMIGLEGVYDIMTACLIIIAIASVVTAITSLGNRNK